jgi:hypothetical protein
VNTCKNNDAKKRVIFVLVSCHKNLIFKLIILNFPSTPIGIEGGGGAQEGGLIQRRLEGRGSVPKAAASINGTLPTAPAATTVTT